MLPSIWFQYSIHKLFAIHLLVMRLFILTILVLASAGCSSNPLRQCNFGETEWFQLEAEPSNDVELLALAGLEKNSRSSHRDTWLQNAEGDLMYCIYRVRPIPSGRCGTHAFTFKTSEGDPESGRVYIAAC